MMISFDSFFQNLEVIQQFEELKDVNNVCCVQDFDQSCMFKYQEQIQWDYY